ncbi:MAG: hypothetical protein QOC73_1444, partial [Actinomycetota bacterium]|nr:hypothetical protein [Actinomycetota bacterium]
MRHVPLGGSRFVVRLVLVQRERRVAVALILRIAALFRRLRIA